MKVDSVILEVDGDPVVLKRGTLPCGQSEGVLEIVNKMNNEVVIFLVCLSVRAKSTAVLLKSHKQITCICGYYRLTLTPWLRRCDTTAVGYFSKLYLTNTYLLILLSPQSRPVTTTITPWVLFDLHLLPFGFRTTSGIF